MMLLIIYLYAIKTPICRREMSLIGSTSFGFAENMILLSKYGIELIVALSSTNATKITTDLALSSLIRWKLCSSNANLS